MAMVGAGAELRSILRKIREVEVVPVVDLIIPICFCGLRVIWSDGLIQEPQQNHNVPLD